MTLYRRSDDDREVGDRRWAYPSRRGVWAASPAMRHTGLARCRAGGCCSRRGARFRDNLAGRPHQRLICEVCRGGLTGFHHVAFPRPFRAQPVVGTVREWPRWNLGQGRTVLHRSRGRCRPGARRLTRREKASATPRTPSGSPRSTRRLDPLAPSPGGAHSGSRRTYSAQRYMSAARRRGGRLGRLRRAGARCSAVCPVRAGLPRSFHEDGRWAGWCKD
jgi:hypothetical protein